MKKSYLIVLLFLIGFSNLALAQNRKVNGKVTSALDGMDLPGVNVMIKGTSNGTVTDINGNYVLEVPGENAVLVFSSVGFALEERTVGTQTVINVSLLDDIKQLSEVVVVGYGTQERRDLTGSIASVGKKEIENTPVSNSMQAIQGRVAGVQIASASGRPGSAMQVRVRGRASVGGVGSNDPLYVIDGVPISNNDDSQTTGGQGISPLASLNPEDIESIQVLKDAASAAIYGSRGSNGVVLITTKKGAKDKPTQINFSAYTGVQDLTRKMDMLNADEYRMIQREARANTGLAESPRYAAYDTLKTYDYINDILRKSSKISNYSLSTSGGSKNTQFYVSGSYFKQDAILKEGGYERLAGRFNLNHQATDKLNFGLNLGLTKSKVVQTSVDNSIYSPWAQALQTPPDENPYNADNSYAVITTNNPMRLFEPDYQTEVYSTVNNVFAEYEIIKGVKFRSSLGSEVAYTKDFEYFNTLSFQGQGNINGQGTAANALRTNWLTEQTLTYNKSLLNDKLFVTALAGFSYQKDQRERSSVSGRGFPSDNFRYLTSASSIYAGSSDWTGNALESTIGRLNLAWEDRYLFQAAVRRDGSSKFGANNRYGIFPSVSAGWRISSESFMENITFLNDLKLRASYGLTGNQNSIGNFTSLALVGSGQNYDDRAGLGAAQLPNPDLKWETTAQSNIGLDVTVLNNKVTLNLDWYDKTTNDLLLARPIPRTSGFGSIQENIGSIRNRGFEAMLQTVNIDKELRWTTNFNISANRNKVLKLYNNQPINAGFVSRTEVGQPVGSFYVIKALGVNPETGDMMYEDLNGDGKYNDSDRQFVGNPFPDFEGGITNTVTYKGFDFSAFFQFSKGNDIYMLYEEGANGTMNLGASTANMSKRALDRWTPENRDTNVPRAFAATGSDNLNLLRSSRYMEDGSYIRLKNITLGYTLPANLTNKAFVRSARVFVTGQNLLTFTKYTGFDPEVSSSNDDRQAGVDQGAIPQLRNVTVGLNIGF
jgi:TonB-linked SusC/RagA family outer membrane protein